MNIVEILEEIEKTDQEIYERINPRRNAIKNFMSFGSKLALSAVPLALGGLFTKAYGQKVPDDIIEVLNFALTLEHLEYRYYETGVNTAGLIKTKDNIKVIRDHEREHVKFLTDTIVASGGTPIAEAKYDYTAKGTFPNVFKDYSQFLHVAQAFEDTGVRAYKGRASDLKSSNEILQAALQIHSVEARHAAHIRFARRMNGFDAKVKPWIVGNDNSKGTPFEKVYEYEDGHSQVLFSITNINGFDVGDAATSSFDEPLNKGEVMEIVKPFMV